MYKKLYEVYDSVTTRLLIDEIVDILKSKKFEKDVIEETIPSFVVQAAACVYVDVFSRHFK